jgi:hypothetical protein
VSVTPIDGVRYWFDSGANAFVAPSRPNLPLTVDPGIIPFWGTPVWRSEMNAGDLSMWNVRDRSTFGLLNDTGIPKTSAVTIDGAGLMHLKGTWLAVPETRTGGQGILTHETGYIDTRNLNTGDHHFSQQYGRWEIRCAPCVGANTRGAMPNFWMRCDSTPGELDIFEAWGGGGTMAADWTTYTQNTATTTIHSSTTSSTVNGKPYRKIYWRHYQSGVPRNMNVGFHTFTFTYMPTYMEMEVDGILVFSIAPTSPDPVNGGTCAWLWDSDFFGSPIHMRINLHIGPSPNYWGLPDPNNRQWTVDPLDYAIDYVRVWAPPVPE